MYNTHTHTHTQLYHITHHIGRYVNIFMLFLAYTNILIQYLIVFTRTHTHDQVLIPTIRLIPSYIYIYIAEKIWSVYINTYNTIIIIILLYRCPSYIICNVHTHEATDDRQVQASRQTHRNKDNALTWRGVKLSPAAFKHIVRPTAVAQRTAISGNIPIVYACVIFHTTNTDRTTIILHYCLIIQALNRIRDGQHSKRGDGGHQSRKIGK